MSTTTLPSFIDALVTALGNRGGLSGVRIYGCPVSPEELGKEGMEFAEEVSIEQSLAAMASSDLEESYLLSGSVLVARAVVGGASITAAVNASAKSARDRCSAILEEVTDELATNDTMSATVRDVSIASQTWHQGMAPEGQMGRVCWVEFTMQVTAHVTP